MFIEHQTYRTVSITTLDSAAAYIRTAKLLVADICRAKLVSNTNLNTDLPTLRETVLNVLQFNTISQTTSCTSKMAANNCKSPFCTVSPVVVGSNLGKLSLLVDHLNMRLVPISQLARALQGQGLQLSSKQFRVWVWALHLTLDH